MSNPAKSYIRGQVEIALAERLAQAQIDRDWNRVRWDRAAKDFAAERERRQQLEATLRRIAAMGAEEARDTAHVVAADALEGTDDRSRAGARRCILV